jgi:hypothetical protein
MENLHIMVNFDDFWVLYPKRVAKGAAIKAWAKLNQAERIEAIEALPNHLKYWKFKGTDKEFIPFPATWLNQMRYLDELEFTETKKPGLPWYSTDELTLAKAAELGITPYAGESYAQLRQRISTQISRQATV